MSSDCIFCRIAARELPAREVARNTHAMAFHDVSPQAPVHILVVPRGPYVSWDDFTEKAGDAEISGFIRAVGKIARDQGLVAPGYRLIANTGFHSHQEIPHFHVHICAGKQMGRMIPE